MALPSDLIGVTSMPTQPFMEHLQELRRRLYAIALSVVVWGSAAYAIQQHLVVILLRPAQGQSFIYTTPGGGIDFLFRICVYCGLILSTPVIIYNLLGFFEPLMTRGSRKFVTTASIVSALLAAAGIIFGYYIGLPAALHFLLHQFTTVQIKPLVTIQSYLGFVLAYMLGSALMFQLPVILLFINRIKPLSPKRLLQHERWAILAAFVLAGLMNPSPNILSQLLVAGPFILMYQVAIVLVAITNRRLRVTSVAEATVPPMPLIQVDQLTQPAFDAQPAHQPVMRQHKPRFVDVMPAAAVAITKPNPPQMLPRTLISDFRPSAKPLHAPRRVSSDYRRRTVPARRQPRFIDFNQPSRNRFSLEA